MGDNYDRYHATEKAIDLAKQAIQSGVLAPVNASNFSNVEAAGKDAANYLASFIEELADRIEKL
jgi:hypothetical protein